MQLTAKYSLTIGLFLASLACAQAQPAGDSVDIQLIVKFTDAITSPQETDFIETLSQRVGYPLTYLKPMSGNAHVLSARLAASTSSTEILLNKLNADPSVVYASPNLRRQHY